MPKDDDDFEDDSEPEEIDDPEIAAYLETLPEGRLEIGKIPPHLAERLFGGEIPGVRCPQCAWRPRVKLMWACTCGHAWNTFGTRGKCPACEKQWAETGCYGCNQMSAHDDWYEPLGLPS